MFCPANNKIKICEIDYECYNLTNYFGEKYKPDNLVSEAVRKCPLALKSGVEGEG